MFQPLVWHKVIRFPIIMAGSLKFNFASIATVTVLLSSGSFYFLLLSTKLLWAASSAPEEGRVG